MKELLGKLEASQVRPFPDARVPEAVLERFRALDDLVSTISDALDQIGLGGALPACDLAPMLPDARIVGQAHTVRNTRRRETVFAAAEGGRSLMGELEAFNQAEPGDVVVIQGVRGVSNMGGLSAAMAQRAGVQGIVVDGCIRDASVSRKAGFPIWAEGSSPLSGKWRLQTTEINGAVSIRGLRVEAGDLILADEDGVAVVPRAQVERVLELAEIIDKGDSAKLRDIAEGVDLKSLTARKYK